MSLTCTGKKSEIISDEVEVKNLPVRGWKYIQRIQQNAEGFILEVGNKFVGFEKVHSSVSLRIQETGIYVKGIIEQERMVEYEKLIQNDSDIDQIIFDITKNIQKDIMGEYLDTMLHEYSRLGLPLKITYQQEGPNFEYVLYSPKYPGKSIISYLSSGKIFTDYEDVMGSEESIDFEYDPSYQEVFEWFTRESKY